MPDIQPGIADVEDELNLPVASLLHGLPVRDLLEKRNAEFEVKADDDDDEKEPVIESCFDFGEVEKIINLDMIEVEDGENGSPFDKYRRKMFDIRDDGKVKKYIVKQGVGPLVCDNSKVYYRYQGYMEYSEVPFDSTLWQCGGEKDLPVACNLAKGEVIPGLHEAILSMRKGEKAEFLIHPDLAFGKMGCPPRIPPEATVLFIVEIEKFVDCGDAFENQDDMDMYERREFRNALKAAKGHYVLAKDFFLSENYNAAARKYRLVINMMHNARISNEEEEKEHNHFLIKNYTNACVCYKKLKQYKRICTMAVEALRVDEQAVFKNSKLLYFWGYAKMILGDYCGAKDHLRRAHQLKPKDTEIAAALKELDKKKSDALAAERLMMQRAFGNSAASEVKIREVDEEEEQFRKCIKEELEIFSKDPNRDSMYIKDQILTPQEEQIYLEVSKSLGLYARVVDGEKRLIHIKKPADFYN